jgi:hypothetical protein
MVNIYVVWVTEEIGSVWENDTDQTVELRLFLINTNARVFRKSETIWLGV